MSNENKSVNYLYFDDNQNKEEHYDGVKLLYVTSSSQYKELYTYTSNAETIGNSNANSMNSHHFVKDVTKPFTYYSISNETYYNPETAHDESDCDYHLDNKPTFENDGCVKLYFCGLVGCCMLCLFGCKHF
jgi:hypothetical protein